MPFGLLIGNVGLIFTHADVGDIIKIIDENKIQAPARVGAVAPLDVYVPAGNTGMEPTKTSFFQALNIPTKITKGTVEILQDQHIIKMGEKVGGSEAALLKMMGINPFFYGMNLTHVYDNGSTYTRSVLELTDEDKRKMFNDGIANITALSLATGFTTQASFPHVVMNAFKSFLAISLTTDFEFEKGAEIVQAIKEGKAVGGGGGGGGAAAPAAAEAPAAKAEAKKEESDEEEEGDMGFGLFD
eukprot:NODE_1257_length_1212_cov_126.145314_g1028_i0.p1 GENE.NODE_1257_length_1212_cov_126.145314_g1028_i0~~NODE_1257_length_1212_cov_126.145314_g1028_i0.p1  ORF type:complete len:243 (-),score=71.94 NODE_1257_length_1212_cov_126.145314_g1028_i0:102-830(-)